ncbi:MAG: hypothetical protein P1U68_07135 [Verrucomicrobiales bacterium]|nr:hypothetical protein [Verrucomicrobiales bacterium]
MQRKHSYFVFSVCSVLLLFAELAVFAFRAPEKQRWASTPVLKLDVPAEMIEESTSDAGLKAEGYRYASQPERLEGAVEQLSFSEGACGVFIGADRAGKSMDFFYLEYEAGNPSYIDDIFGHAPEVCMSATGAKLRQKHPSRTIQVGDFSNKVDVLEFESPLNASTLWVFKLTWLPEDAPLKPSSGGGVTRRDKIRAGFSLKPRPPARILLAGARNYEGLDSAWAGFEELLVSRLRIVDPG